MTAFSVFHQSTAQPMLVEVSQRTHTENGEGIGANTTFVDGKRNIVTKSGTNQNDAALILSELDAFVLECQHCRCEPTNKEQRDNARDQIEKTCGDRKCFLATYPSCAKGLIDDAVLNNALGQADAEAMLAKLASFVVSCQGLGEHTQSPNIRRLKRENYEAARKVVEAAKKAALEAYNKGLADGQKQSQ